MITEEISLFNDIVAGFEVLTTVVMENIIFWDITPCSPLKVSRHFGGKYHLHLRGPKVNQETYQHEARSKHSLKPSSIRFVASLTLRP
jgi:hypothetical protein